MMQPSRTATDPQTGRRVVLQGDQWVPLEGPPPAAPVRQAPAAPRIIQGTRPQPLPTPQTPLAEESTRVGIARTQQQMAQEATPEQAQTITRLAIEKAQADLARVMQENAARERQRQLPGGGEASVEQGRVGSFALRMREASERYERAGVGAPSEGLAMAEAVLPESFVNARIRPEARQLAQQAQRDWVSAALRFESGAAIPPGEMDNHIRTYFPQVGDSEAVIRQKAEARRTAEAGMAAAAGPMGPWVDQQAGEGQPATPAQPGLGPVEGDGYVADVVGGTGEYTDERTGTVYRAQPNGTWLNTRTGEAVADTDLPGGENSPGIGERIVSAVGRGVSNVAGLPVDLLNGTMRAAGLPVSEQPLLGSEWLKDNWNVPGNFVAETLTGNDYEARSLSSPALAPRSDGEAFFQRGAEYAGGGVIPGGALFANGLRIAGRTAQPANALTGTVKNMSANVAARPGMALLSEGGAALGGSGGVSAAETFAPGNDLIRSLAAIGGGFAGGMAPNALLPQPRNPNPMLSAAQRQQISLMPADTGGGFIRRMTGGAAQTPAGNPPIAAAATRTQATGGAARDRVALAEAQLNGNPNGRVMQPQEAGEEAIRAGRGFEARTSAQAETLYSRAYNLAENTPVRLYNVRGRLDEQIAKLDETPGTESAPGLDQLRALRRDVSGAYSIEGVRRMRRLIRDRFEIGSEAGRMAGEAADAARDDVINALRRSGRPEAAEAFRVADSFYTLRQRHIEEVLEPILGRNSRHQLGGNSGEEVVNNLRRLATGDGRGTTRFFRQLEPGERGSLRAAMISGLGRPSAGQATQGTDFSMQTFLTNWNTITRNRESLRTATAMFGREAVKNLEDIATVASGTRQANRYFNASQSGGAVGSAATGATAFAGAPTFIATLAVQAGVGRLLASQRFARWLARTSRASNPQAGIGRLEGIAAAEPAIAQDVIRFRDALNAANDNVMGYGGQAAASGNERREQQERPQR
jgi:hypothetical protein